MKRFMVQLRKPNGLLMAVCNIYGQSIAQIKRDQHQRGFDVVSIRECSTLY